VAVADSRAAFGTMNGGRTWALLRGFPEEIALEFDPQDAQVLYLGSGGRLRIGDGGAALERFADGLDVPTLDLAFDPADPTKLYAATWAAGVFMIDLE
jgi:hypothetical protein